jgi:hypothetical protein
VSEPSYVVADVLKICKLCTFLSIDQILEKIIRAGSETLNSEVHSLLSPFKMKNEIPQQ